MNRPGQTPDEKFLVAAYRLAVKQNNMEAVLDVRAIAKVAGQKETASKNIVKHLAQANFLEKEGEFGVQLTSRGVALAERLSH